VKSWSKRLVAVVFICSLSTGCHPVSNTSPSPQKPIRKASYLVLSNPFLRGSEAAHEGQAIVVDDVRHELVPGAGATWLIASGPLGKAPIIAPISFLDGCTYASIAGSGASTYFGCNGGLDFTIFRADMNGAREVMRIPERANWSRIWSFTNEGDFMIEGLCRTSSEHDCPPIVRRSDSLASAIAPDVPLSIWSVFRTTGGLVYVLASSGTNKRLLVSRDGGRFFATHAIPEESADDDFPEQRLGGIYANDDGDVVVIARSKRWVRYTSKDYGATFSLSRLPMDADSVELAGMRGLAFDQSGNGKLWETEDAGATWAAVDPPPRTASTCEHTALLACGAGGCLVGHDVTRIGWDLHATAR
jgi:hypothetical protein